MNCLKSTFYLFLITLTLSCEGPEGKIGPNGLNSLLNLVDEPPGTNCIIGGIKVETGIDNDNNDQLTPDEVTQTKFICKGEGAGANSLINILIEQSGGNCTYGGIKVEVGLDLNKNDILDVSEITQTKYVCNGANGISSLTVITTEPAGNNCLQGGHKIQVGPDLNGNLTLEDNEIQSTRFLCNLQTDKQVRVEIGAPNFWTRSTNWVLSEYQTYHLIKFNKLNYSNVDSITFVPSMYAGLDPMFPSETTTCYAELYNVTDNQSITNSQLASTVNDYVFKESKNIYDHLPNKEITLGIRIKSENPNLTASTGIRSYIFIYKH